MIKVTRYKENSGQWSREVYWKTFRELLYIIFFNPEVFVDQEQYTLNSVIFEPMLTKSSYDLRLTGISISSGRYSSRLIRRALINKENMIDEVAVKAKYEECRLHAIEYAKIENKEQEILRRRAEPFDALVKELGLNPRNTWQVLSQQSETECRMMGEGNWEVLERLSRLLDIDIKVRIEVNVPYTKAIEAYRILHPAESQNQEQK